MAFYPRSLKKKTPMGPRPVSTVPPVAGILPAPGLPSPRPIARPSYAPPQPNLAQQANERLKAFLTERAGRLQGPAYSGTEREVLRTQALEPIEADRTAARQRALENIGARGLGPTSGIAQSLLNQVDAGFDRARSAAQGDLAYRQISEQRSREQEAQDLLGQIPQLQLSMDELAARPGREAAASAERAARQQQMDRQRAIAQAMDLIGQGGGSNELARLAAQLEQNRMQQEQQGGSFWGGLGSALPFILGGR